MHSDGTAFNSYFLFLRKKLPLFLINRLAPYISIAIIGIFIAQKSFLEFSLYSYLSAAFIFPATIASFMFLAVGNLKEKKLDCENSDNHSDFFPLLCVALVSSLLVTLSCLGILYYSQDEIRSYPDWFGYWRLSFFYLLYITVFTINAFLNCYLETFSGAKISNKGRVYGNALMIAASSLLFVFSSDKNYSVYVSATMLASAVVECFIYVRYCSRFVPFKITVDIESTKKLLALGLPMGAGLAVQRGLIFFVCHKLLSIDKDVLSIFSISISIVSLLTIPAVAISQLHSIFTSNNKKNVYTISFFATSGLITFVLLVFYLFRDYFLSIYGMPGYIISGSNMISASIILSVISTSFLMLITSHFRAQGKTITPQVFINLSLLILFAIPTSLSIFPFGNSTPTILYSVSLLMASFILNFYSFAKIPRLKHKFSS